jgi:NADH-quinone oxidoreductase subunit J
MLLTVIYLIIWAVTLGFGVGVVLSRRADYAAFNLMGVMVGLGANFIILGFQFIGFLQLIVYVGAIMVLFLFVIMLLNLRQVESFTLANLSPRKKVGLAIGCVTAFLLVLRFGGGILLPSPDAVRKASAHHAQVAPATDPAIAVTPPALIKHTDPAKANAFAAELIEKWLLPFEITSLLLLAAVIGAVVVAQRRPLIMIDTETQK